MSDPEAADGSRRVLCGGQVYKGRSMAQGGYFSVSGGARCMKKR